MLNNIYAKQPGTIQANAFKSSKKQILLGIEGLDSRRLRPPNFVAIKIQDADRAAPSALPANGAVLSDEER
jgi:hypothetical protein